MHAEIRPDASGVLVSGNSLLIGPESVVQARRAEALIHHEVGTHLVTQVNGSAQPIKVLDRAWRAMTRRKKAWPSSPRFLAVG